MIGTQTVLSLRRRTAPARRAVALIAAAAVVFGAVLFGATGASAASSTDWWYAKYGVPAAQAAGFTGKGVKVAVIDGPFNASLDVFRGADITVPEPSICGGSAATTTASRDAVHSADVTALIVGNGTGPGSVRGIAPGAAVTVYAHPTSGAGATCTKTIDGTPYSVFGLILRKAVADGNRVISISQGASSHLRGDELAIADAIARGVVIVAANANSTTDNAIFPSNASGVIAVNALQETGDLQTDGGVPVSFESTTVVAAGVGFSSQGNSAGDTWGDAGRRTQGSSLAAPLVAGMVAVASQKYPQASGNQLVQSLIRNTGAGGHELTRYEGGYGYGPASLTRLLEFDPTQYPDENPLMSEPGHLGVPSAADVAAAKKALVSTGGEPSAKPTTDAADPQPSGPGILPVLIVVAIVGLLVVAGVVILLVVLLTRRRGGASQGGMR
ncbi:hypothetical protein GCM10027515_08470 [Schumannella luteola]|nr:S8 family serine peptidase [Schumannella luteola]